MEENDADLSIPAFLRRDNTPELKARVKRIVARAKNPVIKDPPKRARRAAKLLGPGFGNKVRVVT